MFTSRSSSISFYEFESKHLQICKFKFELEKINRVSFELVKFKMELYSQNVCVCVSVLVPGGLVATPHHRTCSHCLPHKAGGLPLSPFPNDTSNLAGFVVTNPSSVTIWLRTTISLHRVRCVLFVNRDWPAFARLISSNAGISDCGQSCTTCIAAVFDAFTSICLRDYFVCEIIILSYI